MKPTAACVCHLGGGRTMTAAIYAAGAPDEARQVADFDRRHHGPGHERVERLPKQPTAGRDIPWGRHGV